MRKFVGTRSQLFGSKSSENIEKRPKTLRFQVLKIGPSDWIRTSGLLNPIALRGLKKCYFTRGCGPANPHGCSLFYKKSITTETADKWILF